MNLPKSKYALTKNRLYLLLMVACLAGFIWLEVSARASANSSNDHPIGICLIKRITTFPCPSCGATRSIRALVQGDFAEAIYWNPLGLVILIIMVICPFWIAADLIFRKETLFIFYEKTEIFFRNKWVAVFTVFLLLLNWIWNINKGL